MEIINSGRLCCQCTRVAGPPAKSPIPIPPDFRFGRETEGIPGPRLGRNRETGETESPRFPIRPAANFKLNGNRGPRRGRGGGGISWSGTDNPLRLALDVFFVVFGIVQLIEVRGAPGPAGPPPGAGPRPGAARAPAGRPGASH